MKKGVFLILAIIVFNYSYAIPQTSSVTGVCIAIEEFIEETSKVAEEVEYLEVSSIMEFDNGLFAQRVKFKDSSSKDVKIYNFIFLIEGNSRFSKVLTVGKPEEFINSIIGNSLKVRTLYKPNGTIILD